MIHHNNCTYCKHRYVHLYKKKGRRKESEFEACLVHGYEVPKPMEENRYCYDYQQVNCSCDSCQAEKVTLDTNVIIRNLASSLDK
jgi:hypothetical protein